VCLTEAGTFLKNSPLDFLNTQIKNNKHTININSFPTALSFSLPSKVSINQKKASAALVSTREKWLSREKHTQKQPRREGVKTLAIFNKVLFIIGLVFCKKSGMMNKLQLKMRLPLHRRE